MWKLLAYCATAIAALAAIIAVNQRLEVNRLRAVIDAQPAHRTPAKIMRHNRPTPQPPHKDRTDVAALHADLEKDGYRCIDGQLFRIESDSINQIGRCPQ